MKKNIITTIIGAAGLAGLATTSYGQGDIIFSNYEASPYYPVVYFGTSMLAGGQCQC
jgi:hypothetical protein